MADTNVKSYTSLPVPKDIIDMFPLNDTNKAFIEKSRSIVKGILNNTITNKRIVIVGPCSIHDYAGAIDYARRLKSIVDEFPNLFIIMRTYFEKPRTRGGWKGFVYNPDLNLDNTCDIKKGLELARKLLVEITNIGLPVACEFLDVITPQYFADLVTYGAIGARTSESQVHRQMASGLSMPIGFKNLTDGNIKKAIDGIMSAQYPHSFLGIGYDGIPQHIETKGNECAHLILRGGDSAPNYDQKTLQEVNKYLSKDKIVNGIIVDCSHGNSLKIHNRQVLVAFSLARLMRQNKCNVKGVMIESNIYEGSQKILEDKAAMKYGVSVTDACIDFETTIQLLKELNITETHTMEYSKDCLSTVRALVAECESTIFKGISLPLPFADSDIIVNYDNDICAIEQSNCAIMMALHRRISYAQKIAELKFKGDQFHFMLKDVDPYYLVTDREIEKMVVSRTSDTFYKVIEIMKKVELEYLDAVISNKKIGYLGGKGSFSYKTVQKFKGVHVSFATKKTLYDALKANEVDYVIVPIYNSLVGDVYDAPTPTLLGRLEEKIELCTLSNSEKLSTKLYVQEIVNKEAKEYIEKRGFKEIIVTSTTTEACKMCIADKENACTLASSDNAGSFLHLLEENIVLHNITAFGLFA